MTTVVKPVWLSIALIIIVTKLTLSQDDIQKNAEPSQYTDSLLSDAENFLRVSTYDSSLILYQKAGILFRQKNDRKGIVECFLGSAACYRLLAKYDDAVRMTDSAILIIDGNPVLSHELARTYNLRALVELSKGSFEICREYLNKALNATAKTDNLLSAETHFLLGKYYTNVGDFKRAFDHQVVSKQIRERELGFNDLVVSESYLAIGSLYIGRNNLDSAQFYLDRAEKIKIEVLGTENPQLAILYTILGNFNYRKHRRYAAIDYYLRAVEVTTNKLGGSHPSLLSSYMMLSILYELIGDVHTSLNYREKIVDIRLQNFGERHPLVPQDYLLLGFSYQSLGSLKKAEEFYLRSLEVAIDVFGRDDIRTADCFHYLSVLYDELGKFGESINSARRTLQLLQQAPERNSLKVAYLNRGIGVTFTKSRQYDSAWVYYRQAYDQYLELNAVDFFAEILNDMGMLSLDQHDPMMALRYFQKALIKVIPGFVDTNIYTRPPLGGQVNENEMIIALAGRAAAFELLGNKNPNDSRALKLALSAYLDVTTLSTNRRQRYRAERSKLRVSGDFSRIYEKGIVCAKKLYSMTGEDRYIDIAFQLSERGKANILMDAIRHTQAKATSGIPDSIIQLEYTLTSEIAFYETELLKGGQDPITDSSRIAQYRAKLFDLKESHNKLISFLEKNYREYYALKFNFEPAGSANIMQLLGNDRLLIEYFVGDSSIFAFSISHEGLRIHETPRTSQIDSAIMSFRPALFNLQVDRYIWSATFLYDILLKPFDDLARSYKRIMIVPDGYLNYIPFEALVRSDPPASLNVDFSSLDYVINFAQINYLYSATLECLRNRTPSSENLFVGIAPVFSVSSSAKIDTNIQFLNHLETLPHTESEILQIAKMFQKTGAKAETFIRHEATKALLRSPTLRNCKYLHIATHGVIDDSNPQLSRLIFWNSENDNGVLYGSEIYALSLQPDLIVLSACQSGSGLWAKGEGIIGFSRAFIHAGAKNLLVSLWQLRDKSAVELTTKFYDHILAGKDLAAALQASKVELIKDKRFSYPLNWSPFILIGVD